MEKRIRFTVGSKKTLQTLHIGVQNRIKSALKKLARQEIKGKPLREELSGFGSLIEGDYRVIYKSLFDEIVVFDADHRGVIYEKDRINANGWSKSI